VAAFTRARAICDETRTRPRRAAGYFRLQGTFSQFFVPAPFALLPPPSTS